MSFPARSVRASLLRVGAVATAVTIITAWGCRSAGPAYGAVPSNVCLGKSEEYVVKAYSRGALVLPLRCGTAFYGFTHMRPRWNDGYDGQIAQAIARGEVSADGRIYAVFGERCHELFRVVVNPGRIGKAGFSPQGIITAYVPGRVQTTNVPLGRTTVPGRCPIIEEIAPAGQ